MSVNSKQINTFAKHINNLTMELNRLKVVLIEKDVQENGWQKNSGK